MKDLIIIGAGATGRERLSLIKRINKTEHRWNIKGFLSDVPDVLDGIECDHRIIDTILDYYPRENDVFVCGIAMSAAKEKVVNLMRSRGAVFETIIHPSSNIGDYVKMGEGCYIHGDISANARLGNFVCVMNALVGGSSVIGDYCTVTGYANIAGAKLGKRVFVGSHAVILGNVTVGDDVFVGAGSVVVKNIKPNTKVFGVPAFSIGRNG